MAVKKQLDDTVAKKKLNDRLDLRVNVENKARIKKACALVQEDMTEFVMKRVMPDVDRILEAERQIKLNDNAWLSFETMLLGPKKASSKLKTAMEEYSQIQEN